MGRVEEPESPKIDLHKAYRMIWQHFPFFQLSSWKNVLVTDTLITVSFLLIAQLQIVFFFFFKLH